MVDTLKGSVGANGAKNNPQDIDLISKMLWANGYDVLISKKMTNKIVNAILKAQKSAKTAEPKGIVEPGGKTILALKAKYTAEARRIANTPPMYEVSFEGKCIFVPQKEYEAQKKRALVLLKSYAEKMNGSLKKIGEGHDILTKAKNNQMGFATWLAINLTHTVHQVSYPDEKKRWDAEKAAKLFTSAVKMKDFAKIKSTMPTAEKAAAAWTKEFNRWWKEATGAEESMQWWISTGKTTGWLAVGFFLAPATTTIAGGWGGAVLAAGITGKAKYYVDNLDTIVNGTAMSALKVHAYSNVAAGKDMAKAAITGGLGKGVDKLVPGFSKRLMDKIPGVSKATAEAYVKRVLRANSAAIGKLVSDQIDQVANQVIGKGGKPPPPKTFVQQFGDLVWTAFLAAAVGELSDGLKTKWNPIETPATRKMFDSSAAYHQAQGNEMISTWKSRLATDLTKGSANGIKGEVANLVVGRAKGTEKSAKIVAIADKVYANHSAVRVAIDVIVSTEAARRK